MVNSFLFSFNPFFNSNSSQNLSNPEFERNLIYQFQFQKVNSSNDLMFIINIIVCIRRKQVYKLYYIVKEFTPSHCKIPLFSGDRTREEWYLTRNKRVVLRSPGDVERFVLFVFIPDLINMVE